MGNKYKFEVKVAVDKTTLKVFKTALKILRYVVYVILVLGLSGLQLTISVRPRRPFLSLTPVVDT